MTMLTDKVRERLEARSTLGHLPVKYICADGHETEWSEVVLVTSSVEGEPYPEVWIQCATCVGAADTSVEPLEWKEYDLRLIKPQVVWIKNHAVARLAEVNTALDDNPTPEEETALLKEKALILSLNSRAPSFE
jgi:hypothetical protein